MPLKRYDHKSYDEYKNSNIEVNLRKINRSCLTHKLQDVVDYVKNKNLTINEGICHGVRRGNEVEYFRSKFSANIIGTDISHTVIQFKHCIEWDFHNIKDEWIDAFDFIYCNSLDHSHSPEYCIAQWIRCLTPSGLIIIEWSKGGGHLVGGGNAADCFGGTTEEMRETLDQIGCLKEFVQPKSSYNFFVLHKIPIDIIQFTNRFPCTPPQSS